MGRYEHAKGRRQYSNYALWFEELFSRGTAASQRRNADEEQLVLEGEDEPREFLIRSTFSPHSHSAELNP